MCFKTITPRLLTRICLTLFFVLFPNNMLRKWLVPSNYISCPAEENSEVKNSFDSRIICTQRWSPRQLTNNYNGEKNTGKRNRTTLMVVVRGTIHTFVSSHFLSSCEKLRKKNRTLYRRYANRHKCFLDINGWQKDKAKGDKIIYSKYSKRFKIVWIILILFTYSLNRQVVFA